MAEPFQKKPFGWHIAGRAWASAIGAFFTMLPFFAVMIGLMAALGYGLHLLEGKLGVIRPRNDTLLTEMVMRESYYYALAWAARILLVVPVAVAAVRYVLADGPRLAPAALLRAWTLTLAVTIFSMSALYLTGVLAAPSFGLLVIVLKVFAFAVPLLLAPALAALAAGTVCRGSRIEMALEDWDGNIWRFAVAFALTLGPLYLVSRLVEKIVSRFGPAAVTAFQDGVPGIVLTATFTVLYVLLGAATMAWCHAWARQRSALVVAPAMPMPQRPTERREPGPAR